MVQIIVCSGISKSFQGGGTKTIAVDNIRTTFNKGELTAIMGPSGLGKSTLLSLIGTLDKPTNGKIRYFIEEALKKGIKQIADFRFNEIGFIFQRFHLLPTLTSLENVLTPLFSRRVPYKKIELAKEVLSQDELSDNYSFYFTNDPKKNNSLLQSPRIHRSSWLLATEPTGNLGPETGEKIFDLLMRDAVSDKAGVTS